MGDPWESVALVLLHLNRLRVADGGVEVARHGLPRGDRMSDLALNGYCTSVGIRSEHPPAGTRSPNRDDQDHPKDEELAGATVLAAYKPRGLRPGTGTSSRRQLATEVWVRRLSLDELFALIEMALQRMRDEMVPIPLATEPAREFMSVQEAAEQLGVSEKMVRESLNARLKEGVHWHRFGGRVLIDWPALRDSVRSGDLSGVR